jgi:CRISPR-associated exonuclease Cas4
MAFEQSSVQQSGSESLTAGLEPIAISALQHVSYCPRQYALIHLEQVFDENVFTLRGQAAHQRVDQATIRKERGVKVLRGLHLVSERLGLVGKADVVEVLPDGTYYPVEYKLGKRRAKSHDALQVAAQALCLEEMTGRAVPCGAIYHVESHERKELLIDESLRQAVLDAIVQIREIQRVGVLPPPVNDQRCRNCSLIELCQPALLSTLQHQDDALWRQVFED